MAYNTKIPLFRRWVLQNFPFIEQDFDALTDYQLICKVVEYLNQVIATVNETTGQVELLTNTVNQFVDYINHYFDNLDVQNEINNKLDEMYANGQLDLLFQRYINDYVEITNTKLDALENKVDALNDLSPEVVSSTSDMTDHSKLYLNTSDGYWYYYNGTQFVQGGEYNSDATDSAIKWYLNDVASDGNNLINPFTCIMGSLKTSDGSYQTSSDYWVTDYIELDHTKIQQVGNYHRVGFILNKLEPKAYYKICYYDEDKILTFCDQIHNNPQVNISATSYPDISSWKYMRIQFYISDDIPFSGRYYVSFIQGNPSEYLFDAGQLYAKSRYTAIDTDGIKSAGIENSRLSENLYVNNIYSMLSNGIMPFTITDFGYASIQTAGGETTYNKTRINLCHIIKVPAGTSIKLSNGWTCLAFNYTDTGVYVGRFYQNWGDTVYFPTDINIRMVFQNTTIGDINSSDAIKNLISNISVEKSAGSFEYTGEKMVIKPKYSAYNTGLQIIGQDSACYGDNYITLNSDATYKIFTMNGDLLKNTILLDQSATIAPHANSVCFGTEKYDVGDTYPLLYVNAYNNTGLPKGACYVYRLLNNMTTSLQQTILINFTEDEIWAGDGHSVRPYGNFIVDTDNNKLYVYVMIDSLNVTRFFKFNLPTLSDGATVRLEKADIIEYFDIQWMYYMQGACYSNGKIYASCGFSTADCKLYAVDLITKKVTSIVPLGGFIAEPETVFVYNDTLYVAGNAKSIFKLQF